MKDKTVKAPLSLLTRLDIPAIVVTLLTVIFGARLVIMQSYYAKSEDPALSQLSLYILDKRAAGLRQIRDPIQRDRYCMGLSYIGRQLDSALQPDARVYLAGMLGPTNGPALGYYYFLRNYLFPRDVEISIGPPIFKGQWFDGTPADSPGILKSNGFDIVIGFPNNEFQALPLTPKGVPKSQ